MGSLHIARQGHWMLFVINGPSVLFLMLLHAACVVDRTLKSNYKLTCLLSFFFNLFLCIAKTFFFFFFEHICMLARIDKMAACLQQQRTHSLQVWLSITLPPKLEEGRSVWSVSFASGILCSLVTSVNVLFFPSKTCSVFCICVQQDF